jgi:hypothetical protein
MATTTITTTVLNQSPTIKGLPHLWTSDQTAIFSLYGYASVGDLANLPEVIPPGNHIILIDSTTEEPAVRRAIYRILETGSHPQIYKCQESTLLQYLVDDVTTTLHQLIIQFVEFSISYERYLINLNEQKLPIRTATKVIGLILSYSDNSKSELEELRKRCGASPYAWKEIVQEVKDKLSKNEDTEGAKLKLELQFLAEETDPTEKVRKKADLCRRYSLPKNEVDALISKIKNKIAAEELSAYELDDLFDLESQGLAWIIPELLPKGETIVLASAPKTGKSLLAIDAAFCIVTGEDYFLGQEVFKGKVLLVSNDESLQSAKAKLIKRGFRKQDTGRIKIITKWHIDNIDLLEKQIREFRPDVVIIDSLKSISRNSNISENSAEFSDNIYALQELFNRYRVAGILIHHANKDPLQMGINKVRGSSAITGASWGVWLLERIPKQNSQTKKLEIDPKDPNRLLSVFPRDAEGQTMNIVYNPENNSWTRLVEEAQKEDETYRQSILRVLSMNPKGLKGYEVIALTGLQDKKTAIYNELNRMVNKQIINCKPADNRSNIYSLPTSPSTPTPPDEDFTPSPPPSVREVMTIIPESIDNTGFEDSHQGNIQAENSSNQNNDQHSGNSHQNSNDLPLMTIQNPCSEQDTEETVIIVVEEEGVRGTNSNDHSVPQNTDVIASTFAKNNVSFPICDASLAINANVDNELGMIGEPIDGF